MLIDHSISGRALHHDIYGRLRSFSYTDSGDLSTWTNTSSLDRTNNGGYHNGSSYGIWYNDGKQVIDLFFFTLCL